MSSKLCEFIPHYLIRVHVPGRATERPDETRAGSRRAGFHRGAAEPRPGGGGGVEQARQGPPDLRDEPRVRKGIKGVRTRCNHLERGIGCWRGKTSTVPYNGAGRRFEAATGYKDAWLEGRSYWSLVHPADVQRLRGAVARCKR